MDFKGSIFYSIISSEVEDTLANKFFSWLKTSNGGEETSVILKSIKLTYQYCVIWPTPISNWLQQFVWQGVVLMSFLSSNHMEETSLNLETLSPETLRFSLKWES